MDICNCDFEYDSYPRTTVDGIDIKFCVFCDKPRPEQDLSAITTEIKFLP